MREATEKFTDYLRFEKRFSPHTVIAYKNDLAQFEIYLQSVYQIEKLEEINHPIVRSWIVSMMESKISARTVNRKITTLKTFWKFLLREKKVTINPMLKIQSPKISKRLPVFVEKTQMENLLEIVEFSNDFKGIRNKLIIEMFYGTGMRLSELLGLKDIDINFNKMTVKVLGKRNKERIIPIHQTLKDSLKQYLLFCEKEIAPREDDFLFVNEKGKKLSRIIVYKTIKAYLGAVTTLEKKSPHVLRHTFATHMLNNGADLNAIKELLGHTNLSATQIYTHNTIEKLKNVHKKAHPKA